MTHTFSLLFFSKHYIAPHPLYHDSMMSESADAPPAPSVVASASTVDPPSAALAVTSSASSSGDVVSSPPAEVAATSASAPTLQRQDSTASSSFVQALSIAPLESRITQDELKQLTDNAKLMEGHHGPGDKKQWFSAPIEVQEASQSDVKCMAIQAGGFFAVRFFDKVYRLDVLSTFTSLMIAAVVLFVAWLAMGSAMQPGGFVFAAILTVLVGAGLGTFLAAVLRVPPLVGMLLAGMIWGNLPWGLAAGISDTTYKFLRNIAVAVILSRAGLTFKWSLTKPVLANVILQSMIPQLVEAFSHALIANWMFPGTFPSFAFALYQGAAIACSSTAVVIPGVSGMQEQGFSVTRGPAILMLCSIAFDAVFAVWFTSFVFELAFPDEAHSAPLSVKIALAPVQIIGGALVGIIFGFICYLMFNQFYVRVDTASETHRETEEKEVRAKSLTLSTALGVGFIFFFYKVGFPGSGTVAVVCCAGTLAFLWGRTPHMDQRRKNLYADTANLWDSFVMPALFSIVGSTIDLRILLDMTLLPLILACVATGLLCKMATCVLVCTGAGYSFKEKLFLAVGWTAKSTVQAATAGKITIYVAELWASGWANDDVERQNFLKSAEVAGKLTNTIVVTSILFCAVTAGISMKILGPRLLVKEEGAVVAGGH